jgi:hypothetical protein
MVTSSFVHTKSFFRSHQIYISINVFSWSRRNITFAATFMAAHLLTTPSPLLTIHSPKPRPLFHITLSAKSTPIPLPIIKKQFLLCNPTTPTMFKSCFLQKGIHGNSKSKHLLIKSAETDSGNTSSLTHNVSPMFICVCLVLCSENWFWFL